METRLDKVPLLRLVEDARKGKIALPQFQRNFVWPRDDIADLLLSILKRYFIGSFLLLEVDSGHNPFAIRPIAGVDEQPKKLRPESLVLDGQQRLTSLHYALAAPPVPLKWTKHPYRFFLDLRKLLNHEDDGLIFSLRADLCDEYLTKAAQFEKWVLPFTEIPRWTQWKDEYEDWLFDTDRKEHERYRKERRDQWNEALQALTNLNVPIIMIPKVRESDRDGIAEVCAIFEKINSTGVSLSVFDLLTARLYKDGIDLHKLWEDAVEDHPLIEEFSDGESDTYGVYALRTIALIRRLEVKSKSLVNLRPKNFENDWREAIDSIERALERVKAVNRDGFGVFDKGWQPYSTLVPVLAAMTHAAQRLKKPQHAYDDIKCWYWGSVFMERYAGSVESISYRDAMDLMKRQENSNHQPDVFTEIKKNLLDNKQFSLQDVARVNSVYRGVMNLVAIHGARDFENNDGISFHDLEDHHIFPRAFLRDKYGMEGDRVNTILNRTLITAKANNRIKKKAPSKYLKDIFPPKQRSEILRSHFIGPDAEAAMERDDYETFLAAREKDILRALRAYLEPAK